MPGFLALSLILTLSAFPLFGQRVQTEATNPPTPGTGTFALVGDIEYARAGETQLLLDLRIPDGPGPFPAIIYLHSGAWIMGDRTGGPAIRQASRGYVVASIDYRLAPQNPWPAQIEDCKAAVRWLRANAARYRIDPERIGVFGTSAGGHLAAVLGTSGDVSSLEGAQPGNAGYSSRVKAVVDYYGPTDLLKIDEQKTCIPLDGNAWFMPPSLLLGCPVQQCREKAVSASPMTYVTPDDPPFLIVHGLLDCLVPPQQSIDLHLMLVAAGVDSRLRLLPAGEHGGPVFDELEQKEAVSEFLDEHLRGPLPVMRRRAVGR